MDWTTPSHLLEKYDAFILDAYGVFWSGNHVLNPAKDFMERVVSSGKLLVILSNATQMAKEEKEKYGSFGLIEGVHYHVLLTSGEISRSLALSKSVPFEKEWKNYFPWWAEHPRFGNPHHAIFKETSFVEVDKLSKAHFIYLNMPHVRGDDQTDPELFNDQLDEIVCCGLPVICPNPDEYAQHGNPARFVVRQGLISSRLEKKGVNVRYIGKPQKLVFDYARQSLEALSSGISNIVMIGDNPKTDIVGAKQSGIDSALLVETGIMPHFYSYSNLQELVDYLTPSQMPNHILKALS
jgi:HAD superfamily hydrolase (TIGR01459 family)